MKAVILAGGSGTRLWPLSTPARPKQFLPLFGKQSLLQMTAERLLPLCAPDDIFVVSPPAYTELIATQMSETLETRFSNIITEPVPRNTGPAIALAIRNLQSVHGVSEDEVILVCPSDHYFRNPESFRLAVEASVGSLGDSIATFGVTPSFPATGYGYIELNGIPIGRLQPVVSFHEKPDKDNALRFLASENFLWNAGIFMFTLKTFFTELQLHAPGIFQAVFAPPFSEALHGFADLPPVSIDVALMEKTKKASCLRLDAGWTDLGSWDSYYELQRKDENGNAFSGKVLCREVHNSLLLGKEKLIALFGISDVVVIETDNAILICDRKKSQEVKQLATLSESIINGSD